MFASRFTLPSLVLLSCATSAQFARDSIQLDTTTPAGFGVVNHDLATSGSNTVSVWADSSSGNIFASRGLSEGVLWQLPVPVTTSGLVVDLGFQSGTHTLHFGTGDNVYLSYLDATNGTEEIFFTRSTDGGMTWSSGVRIDNGSVVGAEDVQDWGMAVSADPAGDHIYILQLVDRAGPDDLVIASDHANGDQFIAGTSAFADVSTVNGTGVDADTGSLCADGNTVHVVWSDSRAGDTSLDDVFYRGSTDGGVTFGTELQIDSSGPLLGDAGLAPSVVCDGSLVATVWQEELASTTNEEVRVAVSTDGGTSFAPDQLVGNYVAGVADVDGTNLALCGGNIVVAWDDDRLGSDAVFVSVSTDSGVSFGADVQVSTDNGVGIGRFAVGTGGQLGMSFEANSPNSLDVNFSNDCGVTWQYGVNGLDASDTTGDADNTRIAFNATYNNFLCTWMSDDAGLNNVYTGGFRPQTLEPINWVMGGNSNFALSGFTNTAPTFAWVFGSNSPGIIPLFFGDGRILGLTLDNTFLVTLNDFTSFSTLLDTTGAGSTPAFVNPLATGTVFFAAALSLQGGPVTFFDITDTVPVTVQ